MFRKNSTWRLLWTKEVCRYVITQAEQGRTATALRAAAEIVSRQR